VQRHKSTQQPVTENKFKANAFLNLMLMSSKQLFLSAKTNASSDSRNKTQGQ
jgi:hypothetical protein